MKKEKINFKIKREIMLSIDYDKMNENKIKFYEKVFSSLTSFEEFELDVMLYDIWKTIKHYYYNENKDKLEKFLEFIGYQLLSEQNENIAIKKKVNNLKGAL